ncbi:hypothetical protein GQ457_03G016970 [Hibiscus cannabinus]
MMLVALLLVVFGLWLPPPVSFVTPLFRSLALLVSVGVPMMLDVLLLAVCGDAELWFILMVPLRCLMIFATLIRPLAEVSSRSLLPSWLCLGGTFHPLPLPCSRAWYEASHWPCSVAHRALTSHCGLAGDRGMLLGLCTDPRFIGWRGLGPLRWLVHAPVSWHACPPCADLWTWWVSRCCSYKPSRFPLRVVWSRTQACHGVLAVRGLWRMAECAVPARFLTPWWLPRLGVQCQGPPWGLRPLRCQGLSCWLVHAAHAFSLGRSSPRRGWCFPAHMWLPFAVAWSSSFRSRAVLWALLCFPCKFPSYFPSPIPTRFTSPGFALCYKLCSFASRIPQCRLPLLCRFLLSSFSFFNFLYYSPYMAESLLAKLGDLNFTAEEQDAVVVVPESVAIPVEDFACSLVGCVLSSGPLDGVEWLDSSVLFGRTIRDNVLKRGPWDFQKHWFALEHADPACTIHDYAFRYMCIWVRIHNIPLSLMTEALARTLGACIGKVVMTDTRLEDGNMGEFLRVRVSLDTTKPLRSWGSDDVGCVVVGRLWGCRALVYIAGSLAMSHDFCDFDSPLGGGFLPLSVALVALSWLLIPPSSPALLPGLMEGIGAFAMAGACSHFLACMSPLVPICGLGGSPAAARTSPLGSLLGLYFPAPRGLWRMAECAVPGRFLTPWWLPRLGVQCQGPPCGLRPMRCQGLSCWLVHAAHAFGLGRSSPRRGWCFPAHIWLPFVVAWCSSFRSWDVLWALLCLPCKFPSYFPSPIPTRFTSPWFALCYKLCSFANRIPQCRLPLLCRFFLSSFSFFDFLYYSLYMAESLLAKLGDLNFTAEEQDAVVVVPESVAIPVEDFACSLIGRVLSSGPLDGGRVARLFRTIWKDDKVQTITEINPIFFLIAFASSSNKDNVLKRGPWDFQKHWFALEHADPACTIHDYAFRYMCIWVRIHNIPLSLMTEALARTLGACIGKVVMTDTRLEDGNMGEFLRVHVSLDITKPLRSVCCSPHGRVSIVKDTDLPPLSLAPSVASSPPASASAAAASVPTPVASDAAAPMPVSAPVGPASSDTPVTAGRTAAVSAPLSVPFPHGEVLVNRMKSVLPNCISSTQAAFVQGRAITDNILVTHELVHILHTLVSRSSQGAVFKLDMEKAFDRVEWPFLKPVMLRLSFAQPWVDLIMRCVSSVSSRVRLRGTLSEAFLPRHGLRQGDPLSPFLFLFYTEGLSAALTAAQCEGRLPGVCASKHGPPMNHLLFAYDSLVFLRNDLSEFHYLKDILSTYSAVSDQKVNFSKSTACFSPRTPPEYRVAVHEALGVQEVSDPGIYLGVPLLIGKNKYATFGRYRDKMDTRALSRLRDGFFWTLGVDSQVRMFRDSWGGSSPVAITDSSVDDEELPLRCRDFMIPGLYTVRSSYLFLRSPSSPFAPPPRLWKILAKLLAVPKVRSFGWLCGRDALPPSRFPDFRVWSEFSPNSDHHFILLDTVVDPAPRGPHRRRSTFRFDACWALEPDCITLVRDLWAHSAGSFSTRVLTVCDGLRHWQSSKRDADWGRISKLRSEVNRFSSRCLSTDDLEALLTTKGELRHLLNVQEVYWAQRSRVLWLSAGDRNTSFFHAKASARRQKNAISGLHDAQGHWRTSTGDVLRIASDYFMELSSAGPSVEISAFLEHISPSVTDDMNSVLTTDFTAEEVVSAFQDINPVNPRGLMASLVVFSASTGTSWGDDFVSLCLDLLRGRADMASVNETIIVLIPKVDKPTSMRQLRPISLCTVIYKTVSKVLVNRMKSVLPNCISSTQAAFVQGRAITDNILVAHELVHTLHTLVSRSSQGAVFKLDMEKAFDRVEWPFLKHVMLRLSFAQPWVDLIMRCVSSVSSRVRLCGTLSEAFLPRRGLRQGDPLSPFLFLFCTEGLSAALTAAQHEGRLPGVRASKHGPPMNHLLFSYDSLVFLRNDLSEFHYLKDILSTYSAVSGKKVNFSKSTAYFSPRTPPEYRVAVHEALGVQEVSDPGIYLGVPLLIGKNKDRWGGFSPVAITDSSVDDEELPLRCRDFMVPGQPLWDRSKLSACLSSADVEKIVEVPISSGRVDTLIWGDHDSGLYTVRSSYLFLRRPSSPFAPAPRLWKILAKLLAVPKVRSFGWRCGRDALPVGSRLRDAGLSDGACPLCGARLEDTLHAHRDCPDSSLALR